MIYTVILALLLQGAAAGPKGASRCAKRTRANGAWQIGPGPSSASQISSGRRAGARGACPIEFDQYNHAGQLQR